MRIAALDIRACRLPEGLPGPDSLRGGAGGDGMPRLHAADRGRAEATMLGFAGRSARGAGRRRRPRSAPSSWGATRWTARRRGTTGGAPTAGGTTCRSTPMAPWIAACGCLAAQAAGQPLWRYIGGARDRVPVYASSLVLADADAYAAEAVQVKAAGLRGYKIHPPGRSLGEDIEIHRAVRQAVGDAFPLMSDPVQPYTFDEALRLGRELERLGYLWLEEPLPDEAAGRAGRTDAHARHSGDRRRGAGEASLCAGRLLRAPRGRRVARRCQLDGRRDRHAQDRASGRGLPHALRDPHGDLPPAGDGQPACLRRDPQFRLVRGALADGPLRLWSDRSACRSRTGWR